uniref:Cell division cycle associated 8 n=1 Tax=Astyanax mexicanus TaxID=7994 RepID=A0A3B1JUT7_ASTMX
MAPRKRTTNAKTKKNIKMPKLEAFLLDFDDEVRTIVERMKDKTNNLLKDADNLYNMALIKLPMSVRRMNWIQYCGMYIHTFGHFSYIIPFMFYHIEVAAQVEMTIAHDHAVPPKSAKKGNYCFLLILFLILFLVISVMGRPKKAPSTSKKAKALSVSKQNNTIRNRKPLVTPARSFLDSSIIGPTPLITPRFDSRLPKTPAVRVPRHREKVYSISVNGSPIAGSSEDIVINVPLGSGECIQLLASEMDCIDLSQLDEKAVRSIRQLQSRLTTLCGGSK